MKTYPGVFEITDSFDSGKPAIQYTITPAGQAANLTKRDLATNVRYAFFGREAQRVQRGRDEAKVMVLFPIEKRGSLETLRDMRVRKADGTTIPFSIVFNYVLIAIPLRSYVKPLITMSVIPFGILFATIITLFLLPILMLIARDFKNIIRWHLERSLHHD